MPKLFGKIEGAIWDDVLRLLFYMASALAAGFTINNLNPRFLNMLYTPIMRYVIFLIISASFARFTNPSWDVFPIRTILISTTIFWGLIQLLEWYVNTQMPPLVEENTFGGNLPETMNNKEGFCGCTGDQ